MSAQNPPAKPQTSHEYMVELPDGRIVIVRVPHRRMPLVKRGS